MFEFPGSISFAALIAQLPGLVFYKNTDFIYTAASYFAANLCGFENPDQFSGRNDFELRCDAADSALEFREEDSKVMITGKHISSLQIHKFADGNIHIFLVRKAPLINSDKQIIGVCSMGSEVTNPATGQAIFNLLATGQGANKERGQHNQTYTINANDHFNQLSSRESELIFYFMRGFNNKEIATLMELSPRTIESYLESIKNKFKCHTRNDLLLTCMHYGFSYIIPQSILQRCMNKSVSWD